MKRTILPFATLYGVILFSSAIVTAVAESADFTLNVPVRISNLPERTTPPRSDDVLLSCLITGSTNSTRVDATKLYYKKYPLPLQNGEYVGTANITFDQNETNIYGNPPDAYNLSKYSKFYYKCELFFRIPSGAVGNQPDFWWTPSVCNTYQQLSFCKSKEGSLLVDTVEGEFPDSLTTPLTGVSPGSSPAPATGVKTTAPKILSPPR